MTKLNQIIALEQGEKTRANKATAPLFHTLKNAALFAGLTRTYEPVEDGGETLPDESARVQHTVPQVVGEFVKHSTRLLDLTATKDHNNNGATADVIVGGVTLLADVPVTFLLTFEKYLSQEVRGLIEAMPVLDPAQDWAESGTERAGIYETETVRRHRTKKVVRPIELAPATKEHAAQVQLVNEDVLAGYWNEKKFSGAVPAAYKAELLDRVETLIAAVKSAREKANDLTVDDYHVSDRVFDYLFA